MGTTAKQMVEALEAALAQAVGVKSVTVDGQTTVFNDRASMLAELDYWQRKVARESGKRKTFRGIDIGSAY